MEQTTTKRWTEEFLAKKSLETDPAAEALIQGIALSQNFNGLRDLFVSLNTNDDTANNAGLPASINAYFKLIDAFEAWKGQEDQVDDVCVIGIRF